MPRSAEAPQRLAEKPLARLAIQPRMNKDIEHDGVLLRDTSQIMLRALYPDEYLVHVPLVPRSWSAAAQAIRDGLAKLVTPATNRLIRDDNATFNQKQLNIPRAEAEHAVQIDRMADDLGGKALAV